MINVIMICYTNATFMLKRLTFSFYVPTTFFLWRDKRIKKDISQGNYYTHHKVRNDMHFFLREVVLLPKCIIIWMMRKQGSVALQTSRCADDLHHNTTLQYLQPNVKNLLTSSSFTPLLTLSLLPWTFKSNYFDQIITH